MEISVIVPAYNEEKRILKTLENIYKYFKNRNLAFEIIVVDDGSKDKTVEIVNKFADGKNEIKIIKHEKNLGKGAAVKTGVLNASGNLILFTDADLSTPIEEFEKLEKKIKEGYDIAIGSRGLKDSKIIIPQPLFRRIVGKIFPLLVRLLIIKDFRDTQCGFKLFKKETKKIFEELKTNGFAFDVEFLARGKKEGYKIAEVGVVWYNSPESKVSLLKSPLKMLIELKKIKNYLNLK
ncbi:MAG: glycosyltransferase family 2 protein [Candidatus Omnitrophica bacterium]|nr:glycosyltransferase family 2 protein [Candidatus Omnitrophota bacterium]MCM8807455.1 glycosyltransferase family 2 protein [Candidatus Omnitrophota bacterium]